MVIFDVRLVYNSFPTAVTIFIEHDKMWCRPTSVIVNSVKLWTFWTQLVYSYDSGKLRPVTLSF